MPSAIEHAQEDMTMSNNDIQVLKEIAHTSPTAERVFTFFAFRKRHRGFINVTKTKRILRKMGESIDDKEFDDMLNELAKKGYGKAVRDYNGRVIQFWLHHPVYQIGAAAIEGAPITASAKPLPKTMQWLFKKRQKPATVKPAVQQPKKEAAPVAPSKPQSAPVATSPAGIKTLVYCTMGDQKVRLELDGDVNFDTVDKVVAALLAQKGA